MKTDHDMYLEASAVMADLVATGVSKLERGAQEALAHEIENDDTRVLVEWAPQLGSMMVTLWTPKGTVELFRIVPQLA